MPLLKSTFSLFLLLCDLIMVPWKSWIIQDSFKWETHPSAALLEEFHILYLEISSGELIAKALYCIYGYICECVCVCVCVCVYNTPHPNKLIWNVINNNLIIATACTRKLKVGQLGGSCDFWPLGGALAPLLQQRKRSRSAAAWRKKSMNGLNTPEDRDEQVWYLWRSGEGTLWEVLEMTKEGIFFFFFFNGQMYQTQTYDTKL